MYEAQPPALRALPVEVNWNNGNSLALDQHGSEMQALVRALDMDALPVFTVRAGAPQPRYLIGSGTVDQVCEYARSLDADCIVVDEELSPAQQRNWERIAKCAVLDRRDVILEIFASRAETRDARLQVELARLEHQLPRLTAQWTHLSRQRGSVKGTRGEGETQLEIDRRAVRDRITRLRRDLTRVGRDRRLNRGRRARTGIPVVALVGYTNAGKTSLLRALADSGPGGENRPFATLDTRLRRVRTPGGPILLSDTVGFLRRLPTELIDAFHSTLEEAAEADILLHVLDVSTDEAAEHELVTRGILQRIGAVGQPMILVLNKADRDSAAALPALPRSVLDDYIAVVRTSATTGSGIPELMAAIGQAIASRNVTTDLEIPAARYDLLAAIHRSGRILAEDHTGESIRVQAVLQEEDLARIQRAIAGTSP